MISEQEKCLISTLWYLKNFKYSCEYPEDIRFFLVASPVGANVVFGVHGRYLLTFFPLFIIDMSNTTFKNPTLEKNKNAIVTGFSALVMAYTVYFINSYFRIE